MKLLKLFAASTLSLVLPTVFSLSISQPVQAAPKIAKQSVRCDKRQILTAKACSGDGLSTEERKLYTLVNQYRSQRGLPSIALSPSLTKVANRHVMDLQKNVKQLTHGWSDCPYDSAVKSTLNCMWKAPQRLGTSYKGYGYENAYSISSGKATADDAFSQWLRSNGHKAVILNQGVWKRMRWNALGIGIYKGYAVLWFGEEADKSAKTLSSDFPEAAAFTAYGSRVKR